MYPEPIEWKHLSNSMVKDNNFAGKYILYFGMSNTKNKNILDSLN